MISTAAGDVVVDDRADGVVVLADRQRVGADLFHDARRSLDRVNRRHEFRGESARVRFVGTRDEKP
jgi:hypothetical protein